MRLIQSMRRRSSTLGPLASPTITFGTNTTSVSRSAIDRVLRNDAHPGDELERARLRRNQPRLEQAALGDATLHGVPNLSGRP